ncbi:class I SAM-dependent methyltransferase [Dendrosporobacter sp. 1207_IL3150]|uniref:class I SAM-dependent methyltransferase n=1 Tax=Dendrosporobacter sp. 1207_IL3150 TaxID=3084054 RepID=UPI002FDB8459
MYNDFNHQQNHWENTFAKTKDMFGISPSESAQLFTPILNERGIKTVLELGAGQGRDTLFFAQQGVHVYALEYTEVGVETIKKKAEALGISHLVTVLQHDVRNPLPFDNETFDACYSNMLFCMAFTTRELESLSAEVLRVLKGSGLNFYTVRNTKDKNFGMGTHKGEDLYEVNGFIIHFFNEDKIKHLAKGYDILNIYNLQEGELPTELYSVLMKKV